MTIAVSGAGGGRTVDLRRLAHRGMVLVGRTAGFEGGTIWFDGDLKQNLDAADAFAAANGLDLPEEPEARHIPKDPDCARAPLRSLDLAAGGVVTILWATGHGLDYGWRDIDTFDDRDRPIHSRGVSPERGVYFLGLPWQTRRGSCFIRGGWHDAGFIADRIAFQRGYMARHDAEAGDMRDLSSPI